MPVGNPWHKGGCALHDPFCGLEQLGNGPETCQGALTPAMLRLTVEHCTESSAARLCSGFAQGMGSAILTMAPSPGEMQADCMHLAAVVNTSCKAWGFRWTCQGRGLDSVCVSIFNPCVFGCAELQRQQAVCTCRMTGMHMWPRSPSDLVYPLTAPVMHDAPSACNRLQVMPLLQSSGVEVYAVGLGSVRNAQVCEMAH